MAGKRAGVVVQDDSFMELGMCQRKKKVAVRVGGKVVEYARPIINPACFHAEQGRSLREKLMVVEARICCGVCPVKRECLEFAIAARIEHGVWGGLLPHEREVILSRRRGNRRKVPA